MMGRSWMSGIALVTLCTAGSASAAINATRVGPELKYNEERAQVGVNVTAGLGGFTGSAGGRTNVGGMIGVTADARPWRLVGVEAGYEGQRLPIDDDRIGDGEGMWRHNLSIMAKSGPKLFQDRLQPYVGAGFGLSYLNASEGAEVLYKNDFVEEVPLAAGVDFHFTPNIFAGARGTYRALFGTSFADAATGTGQTSGGLINVNLALGGRF
jgi:opacity protein-like surface antigen